VTRSVAIPRGAFVILFRNDSFRSTPAIAVRSLAIPIAAGTRSIYLFEYLLFVLRVGAVIAVGTLAIAIARGALVSHLGDHFFCVHCRNAKK
tara:strand:- start:479 stop:754 length:276 start_codon:yes stop_codon:yes gene_type:complete